MAKKGRPTKPDKVKILQGTARADRMNDDQPEFPTIIHATAPDYLSRLEKKVWEHIVPQLIQAKIFQTIDETLISMAVVELAAYWEIQDLVKGKIATKLNGKIRVNKEALKLRRQQKEHFRNAERILSQFGFSPSARQSLKFSPPGGGDDSGDPMDRIFPKKPELSAPV